MNEDQLRAWLKERGVEDEAINAIVRTSNEVRDLYADLVKIGGAIDHESWLEEIASTGRGFGYNQVVRFILGIACALGAFYENEDK